MLFFKNIINYIEKNTAADNFAIALFASSLLVCVCLIFLVLRVSHVGIDLTDEGYYLNWISNPWLYQYYVSQFGYVYHDLFNMLGQSVAHIRQANALISFGLAWLLAYLLVRPWCAESRVFTAIVISLCIAAPSLFILMITGRWVATPSYNSLNFQGYLVAMVGVMLVTYVQSARSRLGWVLIGVGGWLSFMAKPPSAAMLGAVILLYFIATKQLQAKHAALGVLTSVLALMLSAFYIDGSVLVFIERLQQGLHAATLMQAGHGMASLFKLDYFPIDAVFKIKFLIFTAFVAVSALLYVSNKKISTVFISLLSAIFVVSAVMLVFMLQEPAQSIKKYHGLIILAIPLGAAISLLIAKFLPHAQGVNPKPIAAFVCLLLVLPYCYAVGTGNNYWQTAAGAGVFWVMAGAVLLHKSMQYNGARVSAMMPMLALLSYVTVEVVINAMASPYRQSQSLFVQKSQITFPQSNEVLTVADDSGKYLNQLGLIAKNAGFKAGTPLLDFTGHHPGAVYFLQGKAVGQAWMIGGYPGSNALARFNLNHVRCDEIAQAWVLLEKNGYRRVTPTIMAMDGISLDKEHYEVVGKLNSRIMAWGRKKKDASYIYEQRLAKPVNPQQLLSACKQARVAQNAPQLTF
ncbi:MAG: hypothetical protein CVU29_10645 [Betaproteobacteria bacterium HGW-Betaproteobacteria-22]|nr:MAG: hypothetical protein CVU29_10645 [Betaproteobacteria bacterium HGW-Betaproteobacteria-22]